MAAADSTRQDPAGPRPATRLDRLAEPLGGVGVISAALYGCLVTAAWVIIFTIGATVNSQPFRDALARYAMSTLSAPAGAAPTAGAEPAEPAAPVQTAAAPVPTGSQAVISLFVVAIAYTPTNLAVLCALAALIGCLGQIASANAAGPALPSAGAPPSGPAPSGAGPEAAAAPAGPHGPIAVTLRNAIGAVTWGFFVYLVVTSGTIVFTGDPFQNTSPEQYMRLAGAASLLAFVVGWKPEVLGDMLAKVTASRLGGGAKGRDEG